MYSSSSRKASRHQIQSLQTPKLRNSKYTSPQVLRTPKRKTTHPNDSPNHPFWSTPTTSIERRPFPSRLSRRRDTSSGGGRTAPNSKFQRHFLQYNRHTRLSPSNLQHGRLPIDSRRRFHDGSNRLPRPSPQIPRSRTLPAKTRSIRFWEQLLLCDC